MPGSGHSHEYVKNIRMLVIIHSYFITSLFVVNVTERKSRLSLMLI